MNWVSHRANIDGNDKCRVVPDANAINGTADHVHVAVNIEPFVTVSELVKDLKGGSSYDVNHELGRKVLQWQRGYGVVSFGKKNLPWVMKYIANQKEHHAAGTTTERLELTNAEEDEPGNV